MIFKLQLTPNWMEYAYFTFLTLFVLKYDLDPSYTILKFQNSQIWLNFPNCAFYYNLKFYKNFKFYNFSNCNLAVVARSLKRLQQPVEVRLTSATTSTPVPAEAVKKTMSFANWCTRCGIICAPITTKETSLNGPLGCSHTLIQRPLHRLPPQLWGERYVMTNRSCYIKFGRCMLSRVSILSLYSALKLELKIFVRLV